MLELRANSNIAILISPRTVWWRGVAPLNALSVLTVLTSCSIGFALTAKVDWCRGHAGQETRLKPYLLHQRSV
jgi:hypothetical protein